ncbi:hypothetical protein BKA67DRAFT_546536 [Truncatella angustata]|uniref:Uncharacterized protein n=1 Tax=Truncatella angustata TaxID=152316 RepID=A0A9P8UXV8_9PEZI|nr:uncharacterized protein BKA67DRAFT_546536 [Truncatella angustata]KAH6660021.1 hypothetical protein BKA67DRAFT_546536 [Truncatella angustata]
MTPINFVTFLVSLYLVDYHFHRKREHAHNDGAHSSLPTWLQQVIFRPQPYSWVGGKTEAPPNQQDRNWYYHTKQKKLMKMEAAAAFEIRRSVLSCS